MKKIKTQKGITLIALIITIIVLLILAVVAISAVQDSGIIVKAKDATKQYAIAEEKEQITLAYTNYMLDKKMAEVESDSGENPGESGDGENSGESSEEDTLKVPGAAVTETADGFIIEFSDSGNSYSVSFNGEIELMEMIEEDMGGENAGESESGGNIIPGGGSDSGETGEGENTINHEAISATLTGCFLQTIEETVAMQTFKDNGAAEQDDAVLLDAVITVLCADETIGIYFYKIDALYKMQQTDDGITFSYVEENNFASEYKIGRDAKLTKEILESAIKNIDFNNVEGSASIDELIIKNSSNRIKDIDDWRLVGSALRLINVTVVDNYGNEIVFGDDLGYKILLKGENGKFTSVIFEFGT